MWSNTWRDIRLSMRTLRASPMFTLIGGAVARHWHRRHCRHLRPRRHLPHSPVAGHRRSGTARRGRPNRHGRSGPCAPPMASARSRIRTIRTTCSGRLSFRVLAASRTGDAVGIGDGTRAMRVSGAYVTTNYFSVLGTPMALGRDFVPDDLQLDSARQRRDHQPSSLALPVRR